MVKQLLYGNAMKLSPTTLTKHVLAQPKFIAKALPSILCILFILFILFMLFIIFTLFHARLTLHHDFENGAGVGGDEHLIRRCHTTRLSIEMYKFELGVTQTCTSRQSRVRSNDIKLNPNSRGFPALSR